MNNKGQFSIIAALFVAVVLIATVIVTYSTIRYSPVEDQPQVLSAVDETNLAVKQVLGFTVGYYGSVLKVTGNSSYAKELATNYLQSGLMNIANVHPEWGTSFNASNIDLLTYWFTNTSYSLGNVAVNYSLNGLGIYGITYQTSCKLKAEAQNSTSSNQAQIIVTKDEDEPLINLGKKNFKFFRYAYASSTWELVNPTTEPIAFANGTYLIDIPPGVDAYSYLIQVEDPRGIIVATSSFSSYTCTLAWNSTLYSSRRDVTLVTELWQNGTMRWLGQDLELTTSAKPIPPIPVKALHVNQTINGANCEVPFQIEDWASDYRIPLGLTNNASVFNSRTMLVFLVNYNVSKVTIWWNGSDTATQTSLAYTNQYFTGDNPSAGLLTNGIVTLRFSSDFMVNSTVGTSTCNAIFMQIDGESSTYGSSLAYVITNGIVRDIVHQEAEWPDGANNCPNLYAHIVLTLPANVTYYTYQLRLMFVQSQQNRTITEIRPIRTVTYPASLPQTENGTLNGYPIVSDATGSFYNLSTTYWAHHWSQFISGTKGSGIIFTDLANQKLYYFDNMTGSKTGALKVSNNTGENRIEFAPVTMTTLYNFTSALDIMWNGAVVTFDNTTPIYKVEGGKGTGLWIIVECPPKVAVTTE